MKTILVKNYEEMSKATYEIIAKAINEKEESTISMTTGGTPRGLFELMVTNINEQKLNIGATTFLNLDEYIGPKNAPYSVNNFMHTEFYNKLDFSPKEYFLINGETDDAQEEIKKYTNILNEHPRDIQILGLGTNGHIGANEPGTSFDSTIFLAQHDDSTIESTMKEYGISKEDAPTEMITLGFTEILAAKQVILMVSGKHKAEAVKAILEGPITEECPASYLRDKENVIMIVDEDAAELVTNKMEM